MSETTSASHWYSPMSGVALILMMASSSPGPSTLDIAGLTLIRGSMITSGTASRSQQLPGEVKNLQEVRTMQVRLLRGKYRDALTPSDEFAKQKLGEIALER